VFVCVSRSLLGSRLAPPGKHLCRCRAGRQMHARWKALGSPLMSDLRFQVNEIQLLCTETELRKQGTVEEWCLKYGTMMGHADHVAEKVARIITIGNSQRPPLPPDIQQAVPHATRGSWWILFASEDGCDMEIYYQLANYAMDFREEVWRPDRQHKWAKHTLEKIERDMHTYRLVLCLRRQQRQAWASLALESMRHVPANVREIIVNFT